MRQVPQTAALPSSRNHTYQFRPARDRCDDAQMKLTSSATTEAALVAMLIAVASANSGCVIEQGPNGTSRQISMGIARGEKSNPVAEDIRPHTRCKSDRPLDPGTRVDLQHQWEQYASAVELNENVSLSTACVGLHGLVNNCPAWDSESRALAIRACTQDLDRSIALAQGDIDRYVTGGDKLPSINVSQKDLWPDGHSIGGLGLAAARLRELAPDSLALRRFEMLRADIVALQDATSQWQALEPSCKGLEELATLAANAQGKTAVYLTGVAQRLRRGRSEELGTKLHDTLQIAREIQTADLDQLNAEVAKVKEEIVELQCLDPSAGAGFAPAVGSWTQQLEKKIAEEQACRSKEACMAKRLVAELASDICETLDNQRRAQAEVAELRRNASRFGVVDVQELHDAAERVVFYEQEYREKTANYRESIRRTFSAAQCRRGR